MANINHVDIVDPNIHESKGVASAAADSFYVADGAASGSWKKRLIKFSAALTPSVGASGYSTQSLSFTGVLATDIFIGVQPPGTQAIVCGRVAGVDTINLTFIVADNGDGTFGTPLAGTYTVVCWRP